MSGRFTSLITIIVVLLSFGTAGYWLIEDWPLETSFYMTIITISTVGYSELGEVSSAGRAFTSVLILVSIVGMAYWTARITSILVEGDLSGKFSARRAIKMAKRLQNHTIVCGSGTYSRAIVESLFQGGNKLAIVSNRPDDNALFSSHYPKVPLIAQPPVDELALAQAGLAKADFVVAATDSDIDNLLIAMTCKQMNPRLKVFAFSFDSKLASRMKKVGVDEVICPHLLGGQRIHDLVAGENPGNEFNSGFGNPGQLTATSQPSRGLPVGFNTMAESAVAATTNE